jgi:hypothetical protein
MEPDMSEWTSIVIAIAGIALLGLALAYGSILTRRRRGNGAAQQRTEAAPRPAYREEEAVREREEAR